MYVYWNNRDEGSVSELLQPCVYKKRRNLQHQCFTFIRKMQKQDLDTEVALLKVLVGVKHLSREAR